MKRPQLRVADDSRRAARASRGAHVGVHGSAPSQATADASHVPGHRRRPAARGRPPRRCAEAPPIRASSDTRGSPLRATASSSPRNAAGNRATRVPRTASTSSGTAISSADTGTPSSRNDRPSSSAKSGLPSVVSTIRRSTCRGSVRPRRSESMLRIAPKLSGPTVTVSAHVLEHTFEPVTLVPGASRAGMSPSGRGFARRTSPSRTARRATEVVDGDDDPPCQSRRTLQERDPDRVRLGRCPVRVVSEQRRLERPALRRRQAVQLIEVDPVEQVDQARERQLGVGAARSRSEDAQSPAHAAVDPGFPQGRLAGARAADQHQRPARRFRVEERAEAGELGLAPDDLRNVLGSAAQPPVR